MKLPSTKMLALNGAAVMVIAAAVITQVRSLFKTVEVPSCATYYERAVGLGLERNGRLVTAVDIQAGAAGADYGVLDNFMTDWIKDGPSNVAMTVSMRKGTGHPDHVENRKGGISFPWRPRTLPKEVPIICFSYHVKLPADFSFGNGLGTLPGVKAVSQSANSDETFTVHFGWEQDGRARMRYISQEKNKVRREGVGTEFVLPRGRWFRVDQEIGLNEVGKNDGLMRFWIDGKLVAELWDVKMKSNDAVWFDSILIDTHFGASRQGQDGVASKDETIMLSPFELRWRQ